LLTSFLLKALKRLERFRTGFAWPEG